jgi:putative component of membrane protein insertase Oxa1/YidC/SpoIIIJ protein YidD
MLFNEPTPYPSSILSAGGRIDGFRAGLFRSSVIAVVEAYRCHLSPLKGYSCPHRLLHGGMSCSGYTLALLRSEEDFSSVLRSTFARFEDCSRASLVLGQENPRMRCYVIPCCFPV